MTSYICKVRENKSKPIFNLVNRRRMIIHQAEIVKLRRAIVGKMTRFVFYVLYMKETVKYPGRNIHQMIENVGLELNVRMELGTIHLRFRCIIKLQKLM